MSLENFFNSRRLFIIALVLIITTGSALIIKLSLFNEPVIVPTNIESTFEQNEPVVPTPEVQEAEPEAAVDDQATDSTPEPAPDVTPQEAAIPSVAGTQSLGCSDCTLAAVDKQNSLPSSYTPTVVATNLNGGGSLTPTAMNALTDLFSAAQTAGLSLEIISSYRSYQTQQQTFNYWVSTEEANGLSREAAEAEANTYSARPGQSEHQLGTTVDLKCTGCADFDATQNAEIYTFIAGNAHTHGFVISYPPGQDTLTGYTYEPWHIRWIGTELATELFNTGYTSGNGNYLAQFLRDKGLSS